MADFLTYQTTKRQPAKPLEPVIDPAGWAARSLGPVDEWSYEITPSDQEQLVRAVAAFRKTGRSLVDVDRSSFPLTGLAATLEDIRRELIDGRGLVMSRKFPIDRLDVEGVATAFTGFGSYLGDKTVQNRHGHVLGHVKDLGANYETSGRAYNTNAELRFHSDACDYVGLLCLCTAKSGGESRFSTAGLTWRKSSARISIGRMSAR